MPLLLLLPLLLVLLAIGVLAPLVRGLLRLAVAAVAGLFAAAVLPLGPGQGWVPWAVFVGMLVLLSARARAGERRPPPRVAPAAITPRRATIAAAAASPGAAWPTLRRLADWRTRRRLDAAWDACARYLAQARTHESETAQLPIKIARHLPAITADCVRHCRTATRDEQRALIAETLTTLETLAARAEQRRRELAHQAMGDFRTLKAHLTNPED